MVVEQLRTVVWIALLTVSALAPSAVGAGLLPAYDLVGTDPAGDAPQPFASGVTYPACGTGLGCGKFDIIDLEMANDGDLLQVKLDTTASYSGTTSIIYAVHFTAGGTKYLTCWSINSAGPTGSHEDLAENTVACSRFTGETVVGPADKAGGVDQGTDAAGKTYVRWEVPKADIADATDLTDITAEIWSRGPSACCPGSTTQSQYTWNRADVAPDAGVWSYSLSASAPSLELSFAMEPKNATVAPGGTVEVALLPTLTGNGSTNFTWSIEGLPAGWDATFEPSNGSLSSSENATHNLTVTVADNATEGATNLTVLLVAGEGMNATANLTITVDPSLAAAITSSTTPTTGSSTTNATLAAAATDADGIPGPDWALVTAGTLVAVFLVRRRRNA